MKKLIAALCVAVTLAAAVLPVHAEAQYDDERELMYEDVEEAIEGLDSIGFKGGFVELGLGLNMWIPDEYKPAEVEGADAFLSEDGYGVGVEYFPEFTNDNFELFESAMKEGVDDIQQIIINGRDGVLFHRTGEDALKLDLLVGDGSMAEFTFTPVSDLEYLTLVYMMMATIGV